MKMLKKRAAVLAAVLAVMIAGCTNPDSGVVNESTGAAVQTGIASGTTAGTEASQGTETEDSTWVDPALSDANETLQGTSAAETLPYKEEDIQSDEQPVVR